MIDIKQFNPAADGKTSDTAIFQRALDQVGESGGELYISAGKYAIGGVVIRSNTCVTLDHGAELIACDNYEEFANAESSVVAEQSTRAMLFAKGASNVTIRGYGTINGNGPAFNETTPDALGYCSPQKLRPRVILFEDCKNTSITDIRIISAPMWTVHMISCDICTISNITVDNDLRFTNTDSIDIDGCQNVRITNCHLSTADDGVCLKTSKRPAEIDRPCKNIVVSDCVIKSNSCAIKIGTESYNDFENISITNCIISDSNRGIGLVSRDGGNIRNVNVSNIISVNKYVSACHWGKADPIYMSVRYRNPDIKPGFIENVYLSNIQCQSEGAINLHSELKNGIRNINFNNVALNQLPSSSEEADCYDVRPPCNPVNLTGGGMSNAYAIDEDTGRPWGVETYPGGLPGFFAAGVDESEVNLTGLDIKRPELMPANWNTKSVVFAN